MLRAEVKTSSNETALIAAQEIFAMASCRGNICAHAYNPSHRVLHHNAYAIPKVEATRTSDACWHAIRWIHVSIARLYLRRKSLRPHRAQGKRHLCRRTPKSVTSLADTRGSTVPSLARRSVCCVQLSLLQLMLLLISTRQDNP